mgnify:CR=1 FL=1
MILGRLLLLRLAYTRPHGTLTLYDQIHCVYGPVDDWRQTIVVDVANSPVGRALDLPTLLANIKVQVQSFGPVPVASGPLGGDQQLGKACGLLAKDPVIRADLRDVGTH